MYTWGACQLDLGGKETFVRARVDIKKLYAYIWPDTRKIFLRPQTTYDFYDIQYLLLASA